MFIRMEIRRLPEIVVVFWIRIKQQWKGITGNEGKYDLDENGGGYGDLHQKMCTRLVYNSMVNTTLCKKVEII